MKKPLLLLLGLLVISTACEKALMPASAEDSPDANFESLWWTVKEKYSFFNYKGIDWDSAYRVYRPRIQPEMSDEALFGVLDSLLYLLRDGHVNLVAPFNFSRNWRWYLDAPDNFNAEALERHYLRSDHRRAGGFQYQIWPEDSIAYLHYPSFAASFSEQQLDLIFGFLAPAKGLILDLRHNGGGSLNNAYRLAARLIDREALVLVTDEKTGPGPNDFGQQRSLSLSPSERPHFRGPIIVLSNRRSYSATNTFLAMMKAFRGIRSLGDTSGGGGGLPIDYELPKGWRYRFSGTRSFLPNGFNIEHGLPPDIAFHLDPEELAAGRDRYIDSARALLR